MKNKIDDTLKQRGSRYGTFEANAKTSQQLKAVLFAPNPQVTCEQKEALEMIAHKLARIVNGDPCYKDSWVDLAGYATLVANNLLDE